MLQMSPCESCPDFWPECECPARQAWMFEQERAGMPSFSLEAAEANGANDAGDAGEGGREELSGNA